MKKHFFVYLSLLISLFLNAETIQQTYFKNTDYELNIWEIKGEKPGATLLILGGIQGDESGGYLSADHFVDMALSQGNLIIIPRANLPTIIKSQRQINKDMNRRFDEPKTDIFEDQVVEVIKSYIKQADVFLNLHEGGGFFRETYLDEMRNPMKFGQCIIADTDSFYSEKKSQTIYLNRIAEEICQKINPQIDNKEYYFRFNNHNTLSPKTKHPEQRKSATFYALTQVHIPAFGIEASKQLPSLDLKMKFHKMIINEFLNYYHIIPDIPKLSFDKPLFDFAVLEINGKRMIVEDQQNIVIPKNSEVTVQYIHSNYSRGLLADISGVGTMNDLNKQMIIEDNAKITFRKDNALIGTANLTIDSSQILAVKKAYTGVIVEINGQRYEIAPEKTLAIQDVNDIRIIGAINDENISYNFAGYTNPKKSSNDSGFLIRVPQNLQKKYSLNNGSLWQIEAYKNHKLIAKHFLNFHKDLKPALQYTLNNISAEINENDTLICSEGDILVLKNALFNGSVKNNVKINIAGFISNPKKDGDDKGESIHLQRKEFLDKFQISDNLFEIQINQKGVRLATFYMKFTNDEE